jgi:hypothetical protein
MITLLCGARLPEQRLRPNLATTVSAGTSAQNEADDTIDTDIL